MLNIECPYCGFRDEIEFSCGGEAHISRPELNDKLSDKEWSEYLYSSYNPKGLFIERWVHSAGCRQWFNMVRNTVTNEIYEVYKIGSLPKTKEGLLAFKNNWRRKTKSELIDLKKKKNNARK